MTNFYTRKLAEGRAALAPMAGYSDAPFRQLCRRFGSGWAVTEMVSAAALVLGQQRGVDIGAPYPGEPDLVIQVFGGDPEIVAAGGRMLFDSYRPAALDINMGCPVKKITGKSCGSRLMQDPERAAAIVGALTAAVPVPVSAKLRLGFDSVNALEVALALQEAGASLVTIHGRTAAQKYTGEADWEAIAAVAARLNIPVVGSGDVRSRAQVERYCALGLGVMVGRGALGQPWIFAELRGDKAPSTGDKLALILEHARLARAWYGSEHAIVRLRGQLLRYADGLVNSSADGADINTDTDADFYPDLRTAFRSVTTLLELAHLLRPHLSGATRHPAAALAHGGAPVAL